MMATFMAMHGPPGRGVRRADRGGARHRVVGRRRRRRRSPSCAIARLARAPRRRLPLPGRRGAGALRHLAHARRPGQTTAIIGSTGSGKTTLLNLVPRLFDVTAGLGARRRRRRARPRPRVLWSRIGLVPQKPYLFSGTVRQQPALRQARRHRRRAVGGAARSPRPPTSWRPCPAASTPPIAQGGTNVSGGQRQRLAIARALVRQPEIYLFDDSFSALDLATDARLRAALGPVHRGRHGDRRRPAGLDHPPRRPDPRARGRRDRSASAPTTSCWRPARPTPRSSRRR